MGISVAQGMRGREKNLCGISRRNAGFIEQITLSENPSPRKLYPWLPVLSPLTLGLFHFASSKIMLSTMRMQLLRMREPILHQSWKLRPSGNLKDVKRSFMLSPVTTSRRLNLQWEYLTMSILGVSFWTDQFSFSSSSSSYETRWFKFEGWQRVQWWHLPGQGIEKTLWKSMVLQQSHHKYEFSETTWQRNRFWYHWCHSNRKAQPSSWVLFDHLSKRVLNSCCQGTPQNKF